MAEAAGCAHIQVRLVNDAEIARINAVCLGCAGPTNVITFPAADNEPGGIAVSLDCLRREALVYGQDPAEHLIRLLAHGFGHLGGIEHGEALDAIQEACQAAALVALDQGRQTA